MVAKFKRLVVGQGHARRDAALGDDGSVKVRGVEPHEGRDGVGLGEQARPRPGTRRRSRLSSSSPPSPSPAPPHVTDRLRSPESMLARASRSVRLTDMAYSSLTATTREALA